MMSKSAVRREIREKLKRQTSAQRLHKSLLIKKKLFRLAEFKKSRYVMFYLAKEDEVETDFMIRAAQKIGKKVVVPAILNGEKKITASLMEDFEKELTKGPFGILQPRSGYRRDIAAEKIDMVVVPGLAFDKNGSRLGRGKGFYDRFLAGLNPQIPRIGLAFDFQIFANLPVLSHDIAVTKVISA